MIDPRPQVEAALRKLAAEHEPQLAECVLAVRGASGWRERRAAKRELKQARRRYRDACDEARAIESAPANW